jgi:transposase
VGLYNVSTLPWPSRSPDLAPIEHVWDMLNRRIRENHHPFNSLQELLHNNKHIVITSNNNNKEQHERTKNGN